MRPDNLGTSCALAQREFEFMTPQSAHVGEYLATNVTFEDWCRSVVGLLASFQIFLSGEDLFTIWALYFLSGVSLSDMSIHIPPL